MESIVYIDFETNDPFISRKLGAGWVFAVNTDTKDFKVLGCSVLEPGKEPIYLTDMNILMQIVSTYDAICAHNATYELGCLKVLEKQYPDFKGISDKLKIYDTKLLYKLYDNTLLSYSLDGLSKKYLKAEKGYDKLIDAVWKLDIYPWKKSELTAKFKAEAQGFNYVRERPVDKKLLKFAYENMGLIQQLDLTTMSEYAILDVVLCKELYQKVKDEISEALKQDYSDLVHICVAYRLRGVRIDLDKARELSKDTIPKIEQGLAKIYEIAGEKFNLRSCKDMPRVFDKLGIRYPRNERGNPSITTPWLKKQKHEICKLIIDVRNHMKLQGDFFAKIIDMQKYTAPGATSYGILFPELNILEARTGRFSSSSPNIQQQPNFVRQIFLPFEGDTWYSLDFCNQEGRLQIHYAVKLGCEGARLFQEEFRKNPNFDMHFTIAKMMGHTCGSNICEDEDLRCDKCKVGRKIAKTINLGLSYGMGIAKLGVSLGLSTEQATLLKEQYDTYIPYLGQLNRLAKDSLKHNKYIRTISGRKSYIDPAAYIRGKENI